MLVALAVVPHGIARKYLLNRTVGYLFPARALGKELAETYLSMKEKEGREAETANHLDEYAHSALFFTV